MENGVKKWQKFPVRVVKNGKISQAVGIELTLQQFASAVIYHSGNCQSCYNAVQRSHSD